MPRTYVDDNFGTWEIQDEDDLEFYHQVQKESVRKRCKGCHRLVKLRPQYSYCNDCGNRIERGEDLPYD